MCSLIQVFKLKHLEAVILHHTWTSEEAIFKGIFKGNIKGNVEILCSDVIKLRLQQQPPRTPTLNTSPPRPLQLRSYSSSSFCSITTLPASRRDSRLLSQPWAQLTAVLQAASLLRTDAPSRSRCIIYLTSRNTQNWVPWTRPSK